MAYQEESFLGSGDLQIDVYDANGALTGERDVGNAATFAINPPTLEKKELIGRRRDNYAQTIKSVNIKSEQELKIVLTDINRKNLALAMLGADSDYAQEAGNNTESAEEITARLDAWVKLTKRNLDATAGHKPVVKDAATGAVTYEEGDDYEVDYQVGRIKALSTGDITADEALDVTYEWLEITDGYLVAANSVNKFEALLRLIGKDQANLRDCEVVVYKAELSPSGDFNWITDDFAQLELTGKILAMPQGTWDAIFY